MIVTSTQTSTSLLCSYCAETLLFQFEKDAHTYKWNREVHYPEFVELDSTGCPSCQAFRHGLRGGLDQMKLPTAKGPDYWDGLIVIDQVIIFRENNSLNPPYQLPHEQNGPYECVMWVAFPGRNLKRKGVGFEIYADQEKGNFAATYGRVRRLLPRSDALCEDNIQMIKSQIKNCCSNHVACQFNSSDCGNKELPKRLLKFGNQFEPIRLVETSLLSPDVRYTALSHVWGNPSTTAAFLMTTKDSLLERYEHIEFDELPLNFRDAIKVSRSLETYYIWIDSLCIIQDSLADWLSEAPRMCQIYANAHVTIAATSAASAHDGFLNRAEPVFQPAKVPYQIPGLNKSSGGSYFYLRPRNVHWAHDELTMDLEGSTWNSRAWTFQERLLSRRVIHFTKTIWFLECREGHCSEDNRPSGAFINRTPWIGGGLGQMGMLQDHQELLESWYEIIEAYSGRDLTRSSDKLPALHGVVQSFSEMIQDNNCAGIWTADILRGLLWTPNHEDEKSKRSLEARAPSWSWAAWDGLITYAVGNSISWVDNMSTWYKCFDVLDIGEGSAPYQHWSLRVRAALIPISRILPNGGESTQFSCHDAFDGVEFLGVCTLDDRISSETGPGLVAFPVRYVINLGKGSFHLLLLKPVTGLPLRYQRSLMTVYDYSGTAANFLGGRLTYPITLPWTEIIII
ncbi:heterokaryon incompatibility protein-domain-containing protein [Xylariales sp. PMI_506]|nr:heterokaryon incompatibility protein-domain-containing protein [Xylariales sp. PMI_506]